MCKIKKHDFGIFQIFYQKNVVAVSFDQLNLQKLNMNKFAHFIVAQKKIIFINQNIFIELLPPILDIFFAKYLHCI